jgi:2-haloacid dehalogenase
MAGVDGIDFDHVSALTFDCYGTLIDWESGILAALRPVVGRSTVGDESLLEAYAAHEAEAEATQWRRYREILSDSLAKVCEEVGVVPTNDQRAAFGASVASWPAFADSVAALARLRGRFDLGVITNCDDDLFAYSNERLGAPFTWVITAQQVGAYKPSRRNFEVALQRIGRPNEQVVHVAQSLFHDHVPAKQLGLKTVWVNRRHGRGGSGATPPADATPDLEVHDLATLADQLLAR